MIVYVDLEHDRLRQSPVQWEQSLARRLKHKYRFWEVKSPPDGFRVYAESDLCAIQIMAPLGEAQPLFGTQFHPEEYDEAHPDGRRLLVNFFRMAGLAAA